MAHKGRGTVAQVQGTTVEVYFGAQISHFQNSEHLIHMFKG